MAKVSRETASHVEDIGVLESRSEEVDGTTIEFTSFREDADATPFFAGLPDGRCQSRHWGYVLQGQVTFRYADRDEVYEAAARSAGSPSFALRTPACGAASRRSRAGPPASAPGSAAASRSAR